MDDSGVTSSNFYDRHLAASRDTSARPGWLTPLDAVALFWPVILVLLALPIGIPIVAIITGDLASCGRYVLGLAVYGGLGAAWLTVPWAGAYLLARGMSLWVGSRPVLWAGFAGIVVAVLTVIAGLLEWESIAIALPSFSAMVSASVRIRSEG